MTHLVTTAFLVKTQMQNHGMSLLMVVAHAIPKLLICFHVHTKFAYWEQPCFDVNLVDPRWRTRTGHFGSGEVPEEAAFDDYLADDGGNGLCKGGASPFGDITQEGLTQENQQEC